MRFAIGADHAGYEAKERVKRWLVEHGHGVDDVGTHGTASVDYPDFAGQVARKVAQGEADLGVLVCGTGIGMSMAANKVRGIRAAACAETFSARMSRRHNDANVLCLGARVLGSGLMEEILAAFVGGSFEGGRHAARVDKINRIEAVSAGDPRSGC